MGVCGGVESGMPTGAEFVAVTPGTLPNVGVGLLVTTPAAEVCADDRVAIDEVELDLVGLLGRPGTGAGDATTAGVTEADGVLVKRGGFWLVVVTLPERGGALG